MILDKQRSNTRGGLPLFFLIMSYFTQTSDAPYDRHKYKLIFKNKKAMVIDDWDLLRNTWFNYAGTRQLDRVEVLDN